MNLAWKIVVITLLINISGGIMLNFLGLNSNIKVDQTILTDIDVYNVNQSNSNSSFIDTIPVTSQVNWADNLLGLLGLGFMIDLISFLASYMFGMENILRAILPSEVEGLISWVRWLITLTYTFALFSLFTGKNLNEEG